MKQSGWGRGLARSVSRGVGVVAPAIAGITSLIWLPYYPVWSLIYIGLAVVILYGLVTVYAEAEAATH
jgi:hypothetical protein